MLYHDPCADGFTAAWVAHRVLGDEAQYLPATYEAPPQLEVSADDQVYVLDYSLPAEEMLRLAASCKLTWLDHHASAIAALTTALAKRSKEEHDALWPAGMQTIEKSGARLAWDWFLGEGGTVPPLPLVDYVEDRDLWRHRLPHTREVNAVVKATPLTFADWTRLSARLNAHPGAMRTAGEGILARERQLIVDATRVVSFAMVVLDGVSVRVPVVNSAACPSEIGEALCERFRDAPLALIYRDEGDKRIWSARSRRGGIDLGAWAAQQAPGGGGHHTAAGFATEVGFMYPVVEYVRGT